MKVEFEISDELAHQLGEMARQPSPNDTPLDLAKKEIWSDSEIVIANAQTLLKFYADGKLNVSPDDQMEKAKGIIGGLIDSINSMPISWREFVGSDFADEIDEFLGKNNQDE